MSLVFADRVKETTATTGTGTLTLAGAVSAFQSFAAVGNANTCDYCLLSGNGTDWEIGNGTYTASGTTLSRDTVYASSNSGSKISLSGTSTVFLTLSANRAAKIGGLPGSVIVGSGSAVPFSGGTATNIDVTSHAFGVGIWEIWGEVWFLKAASTTCTMSVAALSKVSATRPSAPAIDEALHAEIGTEPTARQARLLVGPSYLTVTSGTTTIYLVAYSEFGVSTNAAYGILRWRPIA